MKVYGISGCTFCTEQKQNLDQNKNTTVRYIDCNDPKNNGACRKIEAFPTWEVTNKSTNKKEYLLGYRNIQDLKKDYR